MVTGSGSFLSKLYSHTVNQEHQGLLLLASELYFEIAKIRAIFLINSKGKSHKHMGLFNMHKLQNTGTPGSSLSSTQIF